MSDFGRKSLDGDPATPEDWREHLRDYHRRLPGATSRAFGRCRTADGLTSYEVLADTLDSVERGDVLDLACGDGYLIDVCLQRHGDRIASISGIDMSEGELAAAQRRLAPKPVRLISGVAQELPFGEEEFDIVLCHLAFMLMVPLAPVAKEVARVLRAGGTFSAVVTAGARTPRDGLWADVGAAVQGFREREFPLANTAGWGDARSLSADGWRELFATEPAVEDFEVLVPHDEIWPFVAESYFVELLEPDARERLRDTVAAILDAQSDGGMRYPLRRLSVRLRS